MPKMFAKDGSNVRRLVKLFVRDGNTVRQLTSLYAKDGNVQRAIYNRIQNFLLSGTAITTVAAVADVQRLTVSGRSNVFLPPVDQEIDLSISSTFNSGGISGSSNTSSSSTSAAVNIGDGLFVDVDNSHTYQDRDYGVVLPSTNGNSITNWETATYNPTQQFQVIAWQNSQVGSNLLAVYRTRTNDRGAAGARITSSPFHGGQTYNQSGDWTSGSGESGNVTSGATFSATNITSPVGIGTATAILNRGTSESGGGDDPVTCNNVGPIGRGTATRILGIRQSGTSGITGPQIGVAARQAQAGNPWSTSGGVCGERAGPNVSNSFNSQVEVFASVRDTAPTGVRMILRTQSNATYTGRRARLRNTNPFAVTITGTFGSMTLAANSSTSYVTYNDESASWNITYSNTVASWSATVAGMAITQRNFSSTINADTALGEITAAITSAVSNASVGTISTSGSNRVVRVTITGEGRAPMFIYNMNGGVGSFSFSLSNDGQTEFGDSSTYTVTAPNGSQVGQFPSSVTTTAASDSDNIATQIAAAANAMTEQPINYTATVNGSVVTLTAQSGGAPVGDWRVSRDDNDQTVNQGNAIITNSTVTRGVDAVPASILTVTRVFDGVSTTSNVTLPSGATTDQIGAVLNALVGLSYDSSTNILTYTPPRDTDSVTIEISSGTFTATRQ